MRQIILRVSDGLALRLKQAASERGQSMNSYASAVLGAAVDPELAGSEAARIRERLARAGLLAGSTRAADRRPSEDALRPARKRAGRGRPLSELVSEERR
jgi:hypothetical protein